MILLSVPSASTVRTGSLPSPGLGEVINSLLSEQDEVTRPLGLHLKNTILDSRHSLGPAKVRHAMNYSSLVKGTVRGSEMFANKGFTNLIHSVHFIDAGRRDLLGLDKCFVYMSDYTVPLLVGQVLFVLKTGSIRL